MKNGRNYLWKNKWTDPVKLTLTPILNKRLKMPIIKGAELYFSKLNPKRPNAKFNKKNPTWEVQIRTEDKAKKKLWEDLGLSVKAVIPDDGEPYYRVNLRKKSIKEDGTDSSPVSIVDGKLNPVDPDSIGNGSIANIRIFQYEYTNEGKRGIASVLMAVQLTKHLVYTAPARDDDFEETETETVDVDKEAYSEDF